MPSSFDLLTATKTVRRRRTHRVDIGRDAARWRPSRAGARQLPAAGGPQAVEDDLDKPRPAAGGGAGGCLRDPPQAAGDHRDVLPGQVSPQLPRALSPLDEPLAEHGEPDVAR